MFLFKDHAQNEAVRLVPDLFFLKKKKSFIWGKSKSSATWFQYISIALNLAYNKPKLYKTLDYWFRNMRNCDFLEKGLGMFSLPRFLYDFSRKVFVHVIFY